MKAMSKNEEITLIDQMIYDTKRELGKGGKGKLHLEAELEQLIEERVTLLFPKSKVKK